MAIIHFKGMEPGSEADAVFQGLSMPLSTETNATLSRPSLPGPLRV
jgi:hypothetical protein